MNNKRGLPAFTLLELIIVIIIIAVLASISLPKFVKTIEYARSTEALVAISSIRQAMERCYLMNSGKYTNCNSFGVLSLSDPGLSPNAHFTYALSGQTASSYVITATRTTYEGGSASSTIYLTQTSSSVTRAGTGAFQGIQ